MDRRLHEGWTVSALAGPVPESVRGRRIPASVPGCVTTDLLAAGLVPDPYVDGNEALLAWVGRTSWLYETTFKLDGMGPHERCDLVCDGLDTVATVRLNGALIGTTANMHRSYRFGTSGVIRPGPNELEVEFAAPVDTAEEMSLQLGPRPSNGRHPFNAIRKMACNFGWDWGPDLPTAGIWRPISLHKWQGVRISSVRPLARLDLPAPDPDGDEPPWADSTSPRTAGGAVAFHVELSRDVEPGPALFVTASVAGASAVVRAEAGQGSVVVVVPLADVELWWPVGYGPQPLYGYRVEVSAGGPGGDLSPLDVREGRMGFRSVSLSMRRDARGREFGIVINGRLVLARGANWIPDDCFPSRVGRQRYQHRLEQAVEANCNLVRVWGGGIYESEDFYDVADELGLLVWQDFLMACAAYAEEEPLRSEFEAEAREAVTRLCSHPSLALWSGGNECLWLHDDWGWDADLRGKTWGLGYYFDIFPGVVGELDPTRPYMPGSPWSFDAGIYPNDDRYGTMHVWDVWNAKDYNAYREHQPRFVAEFGFQGPPAWSTLTRAVTPRPLSLALPELLNHQKANDGMAKLSRGLAPHFDEPRSFDDWHWAMSLNQARAVRLAVAYWRSLAPRCTGTIVWQLNDCWPVISWSAVDGDGRRKPMWYALREVYRDRLLTVQPVPESLLAGRAETAGRAVAGDDLQVVVVNDSATSWELELDVTRQSFDGDVLAASTLAARAEPGQIAAITIGADIAVPTSPGREVLVVAGGGYRALWFFAEDKDLELPPPALRARVEQVAGGYDVVLEAKTLQRDVAILADKADPEAECDDMLFTLLPGEHRRVHVRSPGKADPACLVDDRVLRSANQLCSGRG
ncbi:MAG TPA: glycoside hydrolase family 2 protein [Acidimicrobiales bacterium]|nr:glycoside hydrolase family 2 protein [Acidimicrobiales bacterium]